MTSDGCKEPEPHDLMDPGITWDSASLGHLYDRARLSQEQVDDGLMGGAVFLKEDDVKECQFHFGFYPLQNAREVMYIIIIETSQNIIRFVTAYATESRQYTSKGLDRVGKRGKSKSKRGQK